ncbi:type II CAAX endopeptidase family protein [Dyadobacter sp. 676]|uniref:Type II CAAX endopeptidase family protein n=1 Tax=Dyadobacter sp. 676 TaxID=3088362 RepID=A0AAU8FME5_9BACT
MKIILNDFPWTKVVLYFTVMGAAMQIAGLVPFLNDFWFFFLVSAADSWLLLRWEERKFAQLHLLPKTRRHWLQGLSGIFAGCGMLLATAAITLFLTGDGWQVNRDVDPVYIMVVFVSCLWSSVVQEFVFRGYPFQTMLDNYGTWKAQVAIAIPFGFMHVHAGMDFFSVLTTILTTGLGSVLFGMAYVKTKHLALPIGLHAGWNFVQALVPRAAAGNMGRSLVQISGDADRYNFANIVGPYIVVTLIAIAVLANLDASRKMKELF